MLGPDGLTVTSDGVLTWTNIEYSANGSVEIVVSDGAANAIFAPQVAVCNCKNGGMLICTSGTQKLFLWSSFPVVRKSLEFLVSCSKLGK